MTNECKLTKEEMRKLNEKTKNLDKKVSHYNSYRTMMNETRRELLKFIGCEIINTEELLEKFKLENDQLNYHLSMLEQCFYIINSKEGWKSTPGGIKFLENAQMGDV